MIVKSRRQEHMELTRAAVLEAAADQFAQRGFAATTIDDVAAAARVSKGTVYYHFVDKAQLFEAVFRAGQTWVIDQVAKAIEGRHEPWGQLEAGLDAYLDTTVADHVHRALLQEAPGALGVGRCQQIDEEMGLPVLRVALDNLAATGELVDTPIEMLARILFGALCQAAMAAGAAPHPEHAGQQAASVLRVITAGLRRPTPKRKGGRPVP